MLPLSPSDLTIDLLRCLRFWSRLPTHILASEKDPHGFPDFSRITRMLPLAGAIIGAVGALALALAHWLHLPASIAAGLTLAALILATGAFHEDGLADTADGLGGGATRQRKLEIMKDSRIGAYGGVALVFSIGLRWAAIAALIEARGALAAALAVVGVCAISRVMGLMPAVLLEPARADGAAQAAGAPGREALFVASVLALALSGALVGPMLGFGAWLLASLTALAGAGVITRLAHRQIAGQTGDICGAAEQMAEIGFLLALLSVAGA